MIVSTRKKLGPGVLVGSWSAQLATSDHNGKLTPEQAGRTREICQQRPVEVVTRFPNRFGPPAKVQTWSNATLSGRYKSAQIAASHGQPWLKAEQPLETAPVG